MALYLRGRRPVSTWRGDDVSTSTPIDQGRRTRLHVAHADEVVDLRDAEPVQDVGHQGLEARVLDAGHGLGAVEVLLRLVPSFLSFTHVVH